MEDRDSYIVWLVTGTDGAARVERAFNKFAEAAEQERRWLRLNYADVLNRPLVVRV